MARQKRKAPVEESRFDLGLLLITMCLVAFGMLMIYSTSSYTSQLKFGDPAYFLKKQGVGVLVGVFAMFIVAKVPYKVYIKKTPFSGIRIVHIAYIIAVGLQIAVLAFGSEINGAKRWLSLGPLSIQPSEVTKIVVILLVAYMIQKNPKVVGTIPGALRIFAPIAVLLGLVIVENLSTAIVIGIVAVGMCVIAAKDKRLYFILIIIGVVGIIGFITFGSSFRMERIAVWQNVETHPKGFQILQGLYAIASGGLFGTGLGESMQKLGFIPESHNDMIFSIICEELGIVGAGVVILMFLVLLWRVFRVAVTSPDLFSGMICTGVMIHIATQVVINIAVVTNTIPSTGIPLPFISYGGTSVSILLAEMGLVLGISARRKKDG